MKKVNKTRVNKLWIVLAIATVALMLKAPAGPLPGGVAWATYAPGQGM